MRKFINNVYTARFLGESITMHSNLVIVESPAKAKTIEKFLGQDFKVLSSFGHVRDLPKKNDAIDIQNNFEPTYIISDDKKKAVNELKREAKKADTIWLASDEDREGEAIAWHLTEALNLGDKNIKRIVFHEITKPAILKAIANPRAIDQNLVNGQQARRVLDRLVGFELSPVLWRKIQTGLSAGRVQSVAVRLVVEREREIKAFQSESSFKLSAKLETEAGEPFNARLSKDKADLEQARDFLQRINGKQLTIHTIEQKPGVRSPRPPFTTSTLQQAAAQSLGFSVRQTMALAQRLYESGKITYMRTDSLSMSSQALGQIKNWVSENLTAEYHQARTYKTKSQGAQEAHESIRPTDINKRTAGGEDKEKRLYDLIWRRAVASQMADARLQRTTASIEIAGEEERLKARGEVITFPGFLEVMGYSKDDDKILPNFKPGDNMLLRSVIAQESFTRPPARYTEATLVRKLEELGIGRPSTYAPTITTIQNRGYVEKGDKPGTERLVRILALRSGKIVNEDKTEMAGSDKGKLVPSDVAGVVTDFLVKNFSEVIDYNFTAKVENQFDEIAAGKLGWQQMIGDFYQEFHSDIEKSKDISRAEANQTRILGTDPASGREVSARIGRFGPFVQMGHREDEEKPVFASLRPDQSVEDITLEEALPLFALPRELGLTDEGETVTVNTGRFGPYAKYVNQKVMDYLEQNAIKGIELVAQNVSIDPDDPHTINLEQTLEFINKKKQADSEKEIKLFTGSPVQVLDGRWGPFITDGFKNAKIPKDKEPQNLSLEECEKLLENTKKQKKRLSKSYHGGGYTLLREPEVFPNAILKVKDKKEKKANQIADELEKTGNRIRLISHRGASLIRQAELRKRK